MNEEVQIPENLVGFVIGKGGEQILRLQTDSGCKVQISQEPGGTVRSCTLTGTPESIAICRQMLNSIIERGRQSTAPVDQQQLPPGTVVQELLVPGKKAGLVIGKGGDTIKRLQEDHRVKMVMIQDTNQPTMSDKPLRITGSEADVLAAKEQVMTLLASKDMEPPKRGGAFGNFGGPPRGMDGSFNSFGDFGGSKTSMEIAVPSRMVHKIIGKQGETIKKIQSEADARIQFRKEDEPSQEPGFSERLCMITGTPHAIQHAESLIRKVVSDCMQGGRGPSTQSSYGGEDFTQYPVPSDKCGIVIGKGGENVKQINAATGAYVEISRDPPVSTTEKLFNIKGTPDQIRHAIRLICERAGLTTPPGPPGPGGPPPGPATWGGPQTGGAQGYTGGSTQQWAAPYDKGAGFGSVDNWSLYGANSQGAVAGGAASQVPVAQNSIAQPTVDPLTGQPDYTQAWVEFFRQQGMTDMANAIISGQTGATGAGQAQATAAPAPQQSVAGYQFAPGINSAAGIPFTATTLQGYGQSYPTAAAAYQQSAYSAPQ